MSPKKRLPPEEEQKRVDAISEQVQKDMKGSHLQKERDPNIHKRIHEEDADQNYSGEASPYWNAVSAIHDNLGGDTQIREDAFANPDVLSEEDTPYHRPLTAEGELMTEAIRETVLGLTDQQKSIFQALQDGVWSEDLGERLHTEQAIADHLHLSRSTVQTVLSRIKTKIRRRYEKLKAAKD